MDADPVQHAMTYPFGAPKGSYLLCVDGPRWLNGALPDLTGRTPVLASGSNRSPERLLAKFSGFLNASIPVTAVEVAGADAVYSPHFSAYGAIPATLHPAPGAIVCLYATWLTETQLARMHETEALGQNYDFARLDGLEANLEDGTKMNRVHAYIGRRGALSVDGRPVALTAVQARGRTFPAMTQGQIQAHARDRLATNKGVRAFVGENIADADARRGRTERLALNAHRSVFAGARILAP